MQNYYVFKAKRPNQGYMSLCKDGACIGMQNNEYIDAKFFSKWITFFLNYHKSRRNFSNTKKILFILDGHKSHISLEVFLKAKNHALNMVSLPSCISHELYSSNIFCFKPFKQSFRTYRDA